MEKGIKTEEGLRGKQIHKKGDYRLEQKRDESRKQQQRKANIYFQKNNKV